MANIDITKIINDALPIVAASPVAIKFLDMVGNLVKTLYEPRLIFKNGKATVDVEIYKEKKKNELSDETKFTLSEINKLKNFVNSVHFASMEFMNDDENNNEIPEEEMDFDWLMRFFEAVGNISNENLQKLWGKVLASETKKSNSCSLRTLDLLHNMNRKEAETFEKLSRLVMQSGDCYFIMDFGFGGPAIDCKDFIKKYDLNYQDHIRLMVDCGLLAADSLEIATDFADFPEMAIYNDKIVGVFKSDEAVDPPFVIESYQLTSSGVELYKIIKSDKNFNSDITYNLLCLKYLKSKYNDIKITAHEVCSINNDGEISTFDENDILNI